ncbi:hypothetical protein NAPIS_ORF00592 [Vairimorpha apis BRL 01]|uniref:Uncharacterized protein n=1 Tax=Vairimorpha apis BRL 01 TaxID=1037528 RepID=T0LC19_9MICR|nr:hypothetical protein NAPIS_ORF00592 [Vairimorpha apis BRL 01]
MYREILNFLKDKNKKLTKEEANEFMKLLAQTVDMEDFDPNILSMDTDEGCDFNVFVDNLDIDYSEDDSYSINSSEDEDEDDEEYVVLSKRKIKRNNDFKRSKKETKDINIDHIQESKNKKEDNVSEEIKNDVIEINDILNEEMKGTNQKYNVETNNNNFKDIQNLSVDKKNCILTTNIKNNDFNYNEKSQSFFENSIGSKKNNENIKSFEINKKMTLNSKDLDVENSIHDNKVNFETCNTSTTNHFENEQIDNSEADNDKYQRNPFFTTPKEEVIINKPKFEFKLPENSFIKNSEFELPKNPKNSNFYFELPKDYNGPTENDNYKFEIGELIDVQKSGPDYKFYDEEQKEI